MAFPLNNKTLYYADRNYFLTKSDVVRTCYLHKLRQSNTIIGFCSRFVWHSVLVTERERERSEVRSALVLKGAA